MGNAQPQRNQNFNPNFNMAEYNRRLREVQHQYNPNVMNSVPGAYSQKATTKTMDCSQITRNIYIYKPSIQVHALNNSSFNIKFEYHSTSMAFVDIALGVKGIQCDPNTKQTINVDAVVARRQNLVPGSGDSQRGRFDTTYEMQKGDIDKLLQYGIMFKIVQGDEASEYSLNYNRNTKMWRVVVENYQKGNNVFGIEDIYGGEQGQQCIICMSENSDTMVQPCNHLCLCKQCSNAVKTSTNNCPICRRKIQSLVTLHH